jgi:hypothetical protein
VFIKEEHEVCVVSLVPLGGKPKDTVELVFPYTPNQLVLESLILAGYTVTLSMEYRSVNIRVKAGTAAKATRNPKKTKATKVEEPGETAPSKPQLVESAPKKKRSRKVKAEVVSATADADFTPDVEVGETIVIED